MKKVILILAIFLGNLSLFSCNPETVVETDNLYNTSATVGEDGQVEEEEEEEDEGGGSID